MRTLSSEWDLKDQQRGQLWKLFLLLQSLHEHQVMHKDLDLVNVMVCEDETWRLIDFGISKGATAGGALTETSRPGHKLSAPMSLLAQWSAGGVGEERRGRYQPKLQHEVASLGVVLHAFLAKNKHYWVGEPRQTALDQARNPASFVAHRYSDMGLFFAGQALRKYEGMNSMEKNAQLHKLTHMEMKPSTEWVSGARYSDARDLILLLLDDRNVGYVDAQGTGAFSLASQHPLLWTTDQSNACSQVGISCRV